MKKNIRKEAVKITASPTSSPPLHQPSSWIHHSLILWVENVTFEKNARSQDEEDLRKRCEVREVKKRCDELSRLQPLPPLPHLLFLNTSLRWYWGLRMWLLSVQHGRTWTPAHSCEASPHVSNWLPMILNKTRAICSGPWVLFNIIGNLSSPQVKFLNTSQWRTLQAESQEETIRRTGPLARTIRRAAFSSKDASVGLWSLHNAQTGTDTT